MRWKFWSCLFLLFCALCISLGAAQVENLVINQIPSGGTIFQGEMGLNVVECMKYQGQVYQYVLGTNPDTGETIRIQITNPDSYDVTAIGVQNEVPFYLSEDGEISTGILAFIIDVPSLENEVISSDQCMLTGGGTYYREQLLRFEVTTDLSDITNRLDYAKYKGYVNFVLTTPDNEKLTELMTLEPDSGSVKMVPTTLLDVNVKEPFHWYWPGNQCPVTLSCIGWWTGWRVSTTGQESDYKYKLGQYTLDTSVSLNGLVVSDQKSFTLAEMPLSVTLDQSSVARRDTKFTAIINGLPAHNYQIFIYDDCPPKLTGKICDRPPYIMGSRAALLADNIQLDSPNPTDGIYPIGQKRVVECCKEGTTIRQTVPSGDQYPSKGDWEILDDGTRYYAEVTTDCGTLNVGIASVDFWVDSTVKQGSTFKIKVQDENNGQVAETTVTINPGPVSVDMTDTHGNNNNYEFFLNDELKISGTNQDTNTTYMWLTGPGLDPCGANIRNISRSDPEVIQVLDGEWPNWKLSPNWLLNDTPIGPGNYTLWVASGDPGEQGFCTCTDGVCSVGSGSLEMACEKGVCALEKCPHCLSVAKLPFVLKDPEINLTPIGEVVRCCCPGADCGSAGTMNRFWLNGTSTGNYGKELRIWIFAAGQIGNKNYLINSIPVFCDSTFSYEMNRGIIEPNGISLCQMTPGTYDVIVQTPGRNGMFDVRLENLKGNGDRFVLTTLPTADSRLFLIEGKNALFGQEALQELMKGLDQSGIDDQYIRTKFVLKDKPCDDTVDFTVDRNTGIAPLSVIFSDISKVQGKTWKWTSNDFEFADVENPSYTFTEPGKYTIGLELTDINGKTYTVKKEWYINVLKGLVGAFSVSPENPYDGNVVQFLDESEGSPTSWQWDFGDGSTSSLQSPTHIYASPGSYLVTLTPGNGKGVGVQTTKTVVVQNSNPTPTPTPTPVVPKADFTFATVGTKSVQFTDQSSNANTWSWGFGDGSISYEQNPLHEFPNHGRYYYVTLTVSDGETQDSITKGVYS